MPLSLIVFLLIGFAANIIAAPLEPLRTLVPFFSSAIVPFCQAWLEVPALLALFCLTRLPMTKELSSRLSLIHDVGARAENYAPLDGVKVPVLGEVFEGHKVAAEHETMDST